MHPSLLASVEVKVLHATEVYSSLDLTKVKYDIRRLSGDEKEKIIARTRKKNSKGCENI
jgi:hypothetical protein